MKRTNLCSEDIKAAVASYWRYSRQCSMVAFEVNGEFDRWGGELADILVLTDQASGPLVSFPQYLVMIEVKTSIGDLRRDQNKSYHNHFRNDTGILHVQHFYFAVPKDMANEVALICGHLYPYAGVLGCFSSDEATVLSYRNPKKLRAAPLTQEQIEGMQRGQTATLCRLAKKVAESKQVQKTLKAELKKYADMEKLAASG